MEDCKVVFWLKPAANCPEAEALLHDPDNSEWVDLDAENKPRLKVTVGKTSKIKGRLVSFGRPKDRCDIVLPVNGFSTAEHCFFDINRDSRAIMLYDLSQKRRTRLFRHLPVEKDEKGENDEEDEENGYTLSTDELDNSLSIRSCVIRPNQQYTLMIRDIKFLLIPVSSSSDEIKKFVATLPEGYKGMATSTYLAPETNKDKKGPSNPQTTPHLHSAHSTIRHQLVETLGSGGEAVVNKYLNLQDGNHYAGKIISLLKNGHKVSDHGQSLDDCYADALKKRVAQEVRELSKMRHDNVISYRYTQGWDTNHELRIFMPCYDTTLRKLLPNYDERAHPDWRSLVDRMIKDVSSALEYIHGEDCLHRDIKPDNILVNPQSFCLTDFGMASFSAENRMTESLPVKRGHTWQYAAPEVLRKKGNETFAVDVFSFGVMILECLLELPLATPDPSAAKDIAERTLEAHNGYRSLLKQAWPAAVSMLSEAPSKRPGANRIYEDLQQSGGVPVPRNAGFVDSDSGLLSHKRRWAPEQEHAQGRESNKMLWIKDIPLRPANLRERQAEHGRRQSARLAARRIRKN